MNYDKYKNKLPYFTHKENPEGHAAYNAMERNMLGSFWIDAFAELGIPANHPKADRMANAAWEHGHANGYSEVFYWLGEFWELVKD